MAQPELVSVIIPAYNAEVTLAATLASVRRQTYPNLEIIVVNDGSTDATRAIADATARQDPRIRVLSKPNGGLSEARNTGIRASRSAFVAHVDADDIWHPEKIAKQMAVMEAGGPEMGFVYTGFRRIDAEDRVIFTPSPELFFSGRVFLRHILFNFVGNGSSLLIRREAFDAVGGYEPKLNSCEDHLFQILIARSWTVGVVPEYLTGYRQSPGSMSSSAFRDRMMRAKLQVLEHVRARHPETPEDVLAVAEADIRSRRAVFRLMGERRPFEASRDYWRGLNRAPNVALSIGKMAFRHHVHHSYRRRIQRTPLQMDLVPFLQMDPANGSAAADKPPLFPWLIALEARESAFFQSCRHPAEESLDRTGRSLSC